MNNELDDTLDKTSENSARDRWELVKRTIKKCAMRYSRNQNSTKKLIISQLSEKVIEYETNLEQLSEEEHTLLANTKLELENEQFDHIAGVMFRSKAKWAIEGEKNTKYFMNLEKNRYNTKTCNHSSFYFQN